MNENEMDVQKRDEMFGILCQLSDQQFDDSAKKILKSFMGKPNEEVKNELLRLLDKIACFSWSSSFELKALDYVWRAIGGKEEDLTAPWRISPLDEVL